MSEESSLNDLLSSLNKQQEIAVKFDPTKALQVIAGPGTGKTKVLTSRVAYLIIKHKIKPHNIIVTTFTNKAAKEMIDRLIFMLKDTTIKVSDIMIGTFHSICMKILTRFGSKISLQKDWRIIDEKEIDVIINDLISSMPDQILDYATSITRKVNLCLPKKGGDEWAVHPKMVKKFIGKLKSSAILPEEYKEDSNHDSALCYFYEHYQIELTKVNALDFDDLLMYTFRLLTKERCLPYVQHVFVDEFQDTNGIQMDLMYLFAKGNHHLSRGVTVVGDPDQSIYAFRNALSQNFQTMVQKCPIPSSQVILVQNYRSSQKILDTSETLINQQQKGRTHRLPLKAQFDCDYPPVYINFPTSFLQGPSLARELLYLKALPNLFEYSDFAILVRQRRQIKSMEKALIEHRIPYKIIRGHAFWELKETTAMINILKCIHSENEKNAIISSLQYPARGLGKTSAERIKKILDGTEIPSFQILKKISSNEISVDIPTKAHTVISQFIKMIETCTQLFDQPTNIALVKIFETIYKESGLEHEYLYVDDRKKSELNTNSEANTTNIRHQNVQLLRSYFLGSETKGTPDKDSSKGAVTNVNETPHLTGSTKDHIRNFFNTLSLYSSETTMEEETETDKALREAREKTGFVTISTIHGAKGLEWPVVFIPGCDEGIIPSIFGDDDRGDDSENDDEGNSNLNSEDKSYGSPKKGRVNGSDTINEERRMFFVAQTRAKYLLYLSSVENTEGQFPSTPSRFLTSDLKCTMIDEQKAFSNIKSIQLLYNSMKLPFPSETDDFSIKQLIEDYKKFIASRREFLIWNKNIIRDMYMLDISKNIASVNNNAFTTAAFQLEIIKGLKAPNNGLGLKQSKATERLGSGLKRVYAPAHNNRHVSNSRIDFTALKSFAPKYPIDKQTSNISSISKKLFTLASSETSSNNRNCIETGSVLTSPQRKLIGSSPKKMLPDRSSCQLFAKESNHFDCKIEESRIEPSINRARAGFKPNRKVTAKPIELLENTPLSRLKHEDLSLLEDLTTSGEEYNDTTAAELLHNPNDTIIDNRPIITSAKTLANAARVLKLKGTNKEKTKSIVKNEAISSQFDIFSQLSKAKKKAKSNDGEIIVID